MEKIKIGYDHADWLEGVKTPLYWDPLKTPHLLIAGLTGGGKTVSAQFIVYQILNDPTAHLSVCDFKADRDWDGIVERYGEYLGCDDVFDSFYDRFCNAIQRKQRGNEYLLFDEVCSYALSKTTAEHTALMKKISHLAFMGRSFGYHLIFVSQQFNAKVIDTAVREQFGIKIYMGSTISAESLTMMYPHSLIDKNMHLQDHCGYVSLPGKDVVIIQMPFIDDPALLKQLLIEKGSQRHKEI
ncbi:MAG: hypothetical protein VZQ83_02090 [Eubacterium sp.]|nr:hypothetical protein [Eubacterium sp.]